MAINSQIKLAGQMPSINALNLANKIHGQEDIILYYVGSSVLASQDTKTKQMLVFSASVPRGNKKIEQCRRQYFPPTTE